MPANRIAGRTKDKTKRDERRVRRVIVLALLVVFALPALPHCEVAVAEAAPSVNHAHESSSEGPRSDDSPCIEADHYRIANVGSSTQSHALQDALPSRASPNLEDGLRRAPQGFIPGFVDAGLPSKSLTYLITQRLRL